MRRRFVAGVVWQVTAAKPFLLASVRREKGWDQSGYSRQLYCIGEAGSEEVKVGLLLGAPHKIDIAASSLVLLQELRLSAVVWRAKG
jgi:hypothetical protein